MKNEIVTPENIGMSSKRLELIRPVMQSYVDKKQIAGLNTMIARKGKIVHFEQVGHMDREANIPMTDDTIFRIYSMTKPIICTALMVLYEHSRFHFSSPVEKFIPAFSRLKVLRRNANGDTAEVDLARAVTIRDLLSHTSGLTYDFLDDSPVSELYRQAKLANNSERSLEEMVEVLVQFPLAYQPGTRWHYSIGIDVAAYLIELISGRELSQFLKEKLFDPLGMVDTDFFVPAEKQCRIAAMYGRPDLFAPNMTLSKIQKAWENGFNERIDVSLTYPSSNRKTFQRGGHGLFSTSRDYMRFAQMLLNQGELDGIRILGRKTVELMHMNYLPPDLLPFKVVDPPYYGYGFGLGSRVLINVAESEKPGSVGEFGWSGAARTYHWVDPKEEIIGLLMVQSMIEFGVPEVDFQVLTYQAVTD